MVDYNSKEYKKFERGYKGILTPRAAYAEVKKAEKLRELANDGIYVDGNGILNQRWT